MPLQTKLGLLALVQGLSILGFWTGFFARRLPAALVPLDHEPSHVVAEAALAGLLVVCGVLALRDHPSAPAWLTAGFACVVYATVNIIGAYRLFSPMSLLLSTTLCVASTAAAFAARLSVRGIRHRESLP